MKRLLLLNLLGELAVISLCWVSFDSHFVTLDIFVFCNLLWVSGSLITKNYYINRIPGVLINILNLSKLFFTYTLIVFLYVKLVHEQLFTNYQLLFALVILYVSLLILRILLFFILKQLLKNSKNKQQVVFVGVSTNSIHLKEFIDKHPQYGLHTLGFFSEKTSTRINVLGNYNEVIPYCLNNNVSEIICSMDKINKEFLATLIEFSENQLITIKMIPDSSGIFGRNFVTTFLEYIPLLALHKNPFDDISNQLMKRLFDITFSLLVITLLLSWLFPIISILILTDSRGPILFWQKRSGLLNHSFKCLKFRTMVVNHEANTTQAQKNDPRITKIGAFLRRTSLDELPQFFNVLAGSMSVVGPRPHMLKHTEEYAQLVDKYMLRHLVKPGITGLSQIMGYRGETQHDLYLMKMRVRMDRFYIENWTFYLDLKVIYTTIVGLFKKDERVY